MPRFKMLISIGLVVSLMAGCVTTDPKEGGLLGGIYGIGSGDYDSRMEEEEAQLEKMRRLQQEAQQEKQDVARIKERKQRQQEALENEISTIDQQVHELTQELEQLDSSHQEIQEQKPALQQRLQEINKQLAELRQDALINSEQIEAHQAKAAELMEEIKVLKESF